MDGSHRRSRPLSIWRMVIMLQLYVDYKKLWDVGKVLKFVCTQSTLRVC